MSIQRLTHIVRLFLFLSMMALAAGCGGGGGSDDGTVSSEEAFVASITSPTANMTLTRGGLVNFQGTVTGGTQPYTFTWSFGGGATDSTVEDPGDITFNSIGSYTVKFTAKDSTGAEASNSVTITVTDQAGDTVPNAAIVSPSGNITTATGKEVDFQGAVSGGEARYTYSWDFGGGASSSAFEDPGKIVFTKAGTYKVTFKVTDSDGDTSTDEIEVTVLNSWYRDSDKDGYGDPKVSTTANTQPSGYVSDNTDCDDTNLAAHPNAKEIAGNNVDEDCDGYDPKVWYQDADGDGYGNLSVSTTANTQPKGYVDNSTDLDDRSSSVHPGGTEIPGNGVDEDCDGYDLKIWYRDSDGDGYGNPSRSMTANTQPQGYVSNNADCDDANSAINPAAKETPGNGIDENCDGYDLRIWYLDNDRDGYGNAAVQKTGNIQPSGYVTNKTDCDDTNSALNPGVADTPDNGIDENCDGYDLKTWYQDSDEDGYGNPAVSTTANTQPLGFVADNTDCNDANSTVHPGAMEISGNGIDEDCDGSDHADFSDHLVAYYPFNGNAHDESGNNNNGTVNGAILVPDRFNNPDSAYSFNGSTTYISVEHSSSLNLSGSYSFSAWIYQRGSSVDECRIIDKATSASNDGWYFGTYKTTAGQKSCMNIGSASKVSDTVHPLNQWHHLVAVMNGTYVAFYLDGNLSGWKLAGATPTNTLRLHIGAGHPNAVGPFYGLIDDVRIYNKALSPLEVQNLYNDLTDSEKTTRRLFLDSQTPQAPDLSLSGSQGAAYDAVNTGTPHWVINEADGYMEFSFGGVRDFFFYALGNAAGSDSCRINVYINGQQHWYDTLIGTVWNWYTIASSYFVSGVNTVRIALSGTTDFWVREADTSTSLKLWYRDADNDGYGDPNTAVQAPAQPAGYVANNADCNDANNAVHPGAVETPDNGIDDNCDGYQLRTWYQDNDGDGYGTSAVTVIANTRPAGYAANNADCNDADSNIHPGATDAPDNGIDEDCDGYDLKTWYQDSDSDGFGNPAASMTANTQPAGYVANNADCDDTNNALNPDATELAGNGIDENCDGLDYTDLDRGLVAYYPFNGNADDESGNNNNGTVNGAALSADRFNNPDSAYSFNGTSDYISVPHSSSLNLSGSYSFSAWIYQKDSSSAGYRIIDKSTAGSCDGWNFDTYDGSTGRRNRMDVGCPWATADTAYSMNQWHHLVAVVNGTNVTFYLDGNPDGSGTVGATPTNTLAMLIGSGHPAPTYSFNGLIDDIRIYNRALYASEVLALYNDSSDALKTTTTVSLNSQTLQTGDVNVSYLYAAYDTVNTGTPHWVINTVDGYMQFRFMGLRDFFFYALGNAYGVTPCSVTVYINGAPIWLNTVIGSVWNWYSIASSYFVSGWNTVQLMLNSMTDFWISRADVSTNLKLWYLDADHDGYGNPAAAVQATAQPSGYVSNNSDCNDSNAAIHPGATDIAGNSIDENCDGRDLKTWYRDADVDGYGNPAVSTTANVRPSGYVADNSDCNDSNASIHPGATDISGDGIDQDCNGSIDDGYTPVTLMVPTEYATIQAAVDAAHDGDTILVADGSYTENVNVTKQVVITSENGAGFTTVVAANANDHVFEVLANYVTINGFTVYGATAGTAYPYSAGIYLAGSAGYCTITNNRCGYDSTHRNVFGISIDGSDYNIVENNVASGNIRVGIDLGSFSNGNRISENTSSGNVNGIYLASPLGDVNVVSRNVCTQNTNGLYADNPNGCFIYLNSFIANTWHNVYAYGSSCTWHSPAQMTYGFNGSTHTGYLGNYYSDYAAATGGNDNDGNGIGSAAYTVDSTNSATDQYPLWQQLADYTLTVWYQDADGDGYSSGTILVSASRPGSDYYLDTQLTATSGDLYDDDPQSYPGAPEICGDGRDNDCDGIADEGCDGTRGRVVLKSPTPRLEDMGFDYLGAQYDSYYTDPLHWIINYIDGYMDFTFTDPADFAFHAAGSTYSGESLTFVDVYVNGVRYLANQFIEKAWNWYSIAASNFVSGINTVRIMLTGLTNFWVDEVNVSTTLKVWYQDADGDGYGNVYAATQAAVQPAGYVANNEDCDDSNADIHPGADEIADNWIDDDCNGTVDSTLFADNFEHSNPLGKWVIGGRQAEGVNVANSVQRNGSTRAHLYKESFTEITIIPSRKPFVYSPNLVFNFDMEVRVSSTSVPSSNYYCKAGVDFEFRDSTGAVLGRVSYLAASTSYPFDQAASDAATAANELAQNVNAHYSLPVSELLSQITINHTNIASVTMSFITYSSTRPLPYIQAELWVDNVSVGTDNASTVVPDITGMSYYDAAATLGNAGLNVGTISYVYSSTVPPYAVISQGSAAGSQTGIGETVDFVVSLGEADADASVAQIGYISNGSGGYAIWNMALEYPLGVGAINSGTSEAVLGGSGPIANYLTNWTGPLTALSPYNGEIVKIEETRKTAQFTASGTVRTLTGTGTVSETISGTGNLDYRVVTIMGGRYSGYFFSTGTYTLPNGYTGTIYATGSNSVQWTGVLQGGINGLYTHNGYQGSFMVTSKAGSVAASGTVACTWSQPTTVYTMPYEGVAVLYSNLSWHGTYYYGSNSGTSDHTGSMVFLPMYDSGFYVESGAASPSSYSFLNGNTANNPYAAIVSPSKNITIHRGETLNFCGAVTGVAWPYTFTWDLNGDGFVDSSAKDAGTYMFSSTGTYTVSFTATDSSGAYNTDTIVVTVEP